MAAGDAAPGAAQCEKPIWQDEFDGQQLDASRWRHVPGDGCDQNLCGWGNGEEQWYLPKNVRVADGALRITAQREKHQGRKYTSGKISTEGAGLLCPWAYRSAHEAAQGGRLLASVLGHASEY